MVGIDREGVVCGSVLINFEIGEDEDLEGYLLPCVVPVNFPTGAALRLLRNKC